MREDPFIEPDNLLILPVPAGVEFIWAHEIPAQIEAKQLKDTAQRGSATTMHPENHDPTATNKLSHE